MRAVPFGLLPRSNEDRRCRETVHAHHIAYPESCAREPSAAQMSIHENTAATSAARSITLCFAERVCGSLAAADGHYADTPALRRLSTSWGPAE